MIKRLNKKGQSMTTGEIIGIVLGVLILVFLVVGFTMGWDKFLPFLTKSNVNGVVQACNIACTTGSQYDYCTLQRDVKFGEDKTNDGKYTCKTLESNNVGLSSCANINCP